MKAGDYGILVRDTSGRLVVVPYYKPGLGDYAILAKDISNRDVATRYIKPAKGDYAYLAQDTTGRKVAVKIGPTPKSNCPLCGAGNNVPTTISIAISGVQLNSGLCFENTNSWWKLAQASGYNFAGNLSMLFASADECWWGSPAGVSGTYDHYHYCLGPPINHCCYVDGEVPVDTSHVGVVISWANPEHTQMRMRIGLSVGPLNEYAFSYSGILEDCNSIQGIYASQISGDHPFSGGYAEIL